VGGHHTVDDEYRLPEGAYVHDQHQEGTSVSCTRFYRTKLVPFK
jgi:hypothetical protein